MEMNIIGKEPKYNLRDCLNDCSMEVLEYLFEVHKSNYTKKFSKKTEYIDYLSKKIPQEFIKYLDIPFCFSAYRILTTCNEENDYNDELILNGFMFHYHYDDPDKECVNAIPNEIQESFFKNFTKTRKDIYFSNVVQRYINNYLHAAGYVPKERLKEIVLNLEEIKVTEEQFYRIIDDSKIMTYKDNYTLLPNELCEIIEQNKADCPYNSIDIVQLEKHELLRNKILEDILSILDIKKEENKYMAAIAIELNLCMGYQILYKAAEEIQEKFNIDDKKTYKIKDIIEENKSEFRFWNINGNTNEEYQSNVFLENGILKNKPNKDELKSCLEKMPKEGLELIKVYFDIKSDNIDNVKNEILENVEDVLYDYDVNYLELLLKLNNKIYSNYIYSNLLFSGIVFLVKEEYGINIFIPKEMRKIIINIIEAKRNKDIAYVLVNRYLKENGVIGIDNLLGLLNNNHQLEISDDILMDIVIEQNIPIRNEKYLVFATGLSDEDLEEIIRQKKLISRQHIVNISDPDYSEDFINEVESYVMDLQVEEKEIICSYFMSMIFLGGYDKYILRQILKMNNLEKHFKSLDNIAQKYKNKIAIWTLNGFSIIEFNQFSSKKNIGRNDPCPCGSGLKYKKCCGKNI